MENSFSYKRFKLLLLRQWIENRKLFLMGVGVIFGLGLLFYGLSTSWKMATIDKTIQISTFMIGLYFGGAIFTNYLFKDFSEKTSTTNILMLPATHFEKLFSGIFYSCIIYPIVFLTLYFVIDYSFVSYLNSNHDLLMEGNKIAISNWRSNVLFFEQLWINHKQIIHISIGIWLFIQTFAILGTISFGRWSFIKSAFSGFAIFIFLVFVNFLFIKLLLADLLIKLSSSGFIKEGQLINIQGKPITDLSSEILIKMIQYVFPAILLIASFFKLKEKQV